MGFTVACNRFDKGFSGPQNRLSTAAGTTAGAGAGLRRVFRIFPLAICCRGQREWGCVDNPFIVEVRKTADWKDELDELLRQEARGRKDQAKELEVDNKAKEANKQEAIKFVNGTCLQAFREIEKGFQERNMSAHVVIEPAGTKISITIERHGAEPAEKMQFKYEIDVFCDAVEPRPEVTWQNTGHKPLLSGVPYAIRRDGRVLDIDAITKEDIIGDFRKAYKRTFSA
jgi:hypothetical protein